MVRTPRGRAASPAAWEHLGLSAPTPAATGVGNGTGPAAHASGGARLGPRAADGGQVPLPWDDAGDDGQG